jgi:hypothetical protein
MALPVLNKSVYTVKLKSTQETVEYTPYNVAQEKNLLLAKETEDNSRIIEQTLRVIEECTLTPNVNIRTLPAFDIELLFLHIRTKSVGNKVEVPQACGECKNVLKYVLDLSDISISSEVKHGEDLDIIISEEQGLGVRLRYPRIDDLAFKSDNDIENTFTLMSSCITHIFTKEDIFDCSSESKEDVYDFVGNLYEEQFTKLTQWFEAMPSIELKNKYICEKCGAENNETIKGLHNFFT